MAHLAIAAAGAWAGGAVFGAGELFLGVTGKGLGWAVGALVGSAFAGGKDRSGPALDELRLSAAEFQQAITEESTT